MKQRRLEIDFRPLGAAYSASGQPGFSFLYSGLCSYGLGRYSILAVNPSREVKVCAGDESAFSILQKHLPAASNEKKGSLPFYGGAIGYFSYDAGRGLEKGKLRQLSDTDLVGRFNLYEGGIVFDHEERCTWLVTEKEEFGAELEALADLVSNAESPKGESFVLQEPLRSNFSRDEYQAAVEKIRSLIRSGEVYQVNLSQRFEAKCSGDGFELFSRLAQLSPAPYSAYLDFGDEQIVSSSPERFLLIDNGFATTRPIKGTRPTGSTREEENENARDLECSEKDRSELLMIVDLERNDLGKVSRPGSVRVSDLFRLERYATVIHQTADVSGQLDEGVEPLDCIKAMFPGGSITGAPKLRSMQVIDELERGERGIYTGSIGYLDLSGRADFNIAIRTLRIANGKVSFQVGGGVVWDSDPLSEYEETLLKARAMVSALGGELYE
ncbi:aminodeoxychorismate synthase component I [Pelagicoccus albus]|uniref:aminodeoxychorismate synthase n=1 Tax=Pelagicoccus albus TaxID=415222 RepID=A0A7X1E900_9BACT|nr:aminodeoxychorismate synthase component I [Pelagicoccus albus]MBC2606904.1 aminodeoxychorismate synthase component I [Pelagicoccus albus]